MTNIIYHNIAKIGGIETFLYYLARIYNKYDITIIYKTADEKQLKRLQKYVRCVKYNGQKIRCKRAFFNYNIDIIDNIEADEYYQIIHGDYKATGIKPNTHPKITKYLGISQLVCETFKELTGIEAEVIYNPIIDHKKKKILKLISATRLTKEKGLKRIEKLANILNEKGIPFEWQIYTNNIDINIDNVIIRKPRLDILDYIAEADYLVQLSDTEGYCYSIVEALKLGVPIICTDMPILKEIGVNKQNSYILDMDMNEINVNEIYNNIPKFSDYQEPKCLIDKYIDKVKSNYEEERKMKYKVEALDTYETKNITDVSLKRIPKKGEQFEVNKERLDILLGNNEYHEVFVKLIGEVKEIETATKKAKVETAVKKTRKKSK